MDTGVMPITSKIDKAERERRSQAVASALASVRIEALDPGREALAIASRFIEGELTIEEFGAEISHLERRLSSNGG
jgi:hypothetical protein